MAPMVESVPADHQDVGVRSRDRADTARSGAILGPDGLDQDGASGAEGQPLDIAFEVKSKASEVNR